MTESPRAIFTPQLLIQVLTLVVTLTAGWVTLSNRLTAVDSKLAGIEGKLPNKEVIDLKISAMEREVNNLRDIVSTQDAWIRNTRERLAEKGWKP